MREIKFAGEFTYRIWCSNDKRMLYTNDDVEAFAKENGETNEDVLSCVFSDTSAQRSTGLKDKNGKEIYEGDVVMSPNYQCDPSNGDDPMELSEVRFVDGAFIAGDYCLREFELQDTEIIGNIYQNPDLLGSLMG